MVELEKSPKAFQVRNDGVCNCDAGVLPELAQPRRLRVKKPTPNQSFAQLSNPSKKFAHELQSYLSKQAHWNSIARWLLIGLALLMLFDWFGQDLVEEIEIVEKWIEGHGALGWIVFVAMIVVLTSVFFPISVLAMAAGATFGLVGGTILTFAGALVTGAVNFHVADKLMRARIDKMLEKYPKLRAIQLAANREGLRLQLLLRMAPINAVSVSYVLGATGVRFSTFMIALLGLLPSIIVNVYFGYTASHMTKVTGKASEHSTLQTTVTVVGLLVCITVMVAITRVATKAISETNNDNV